MTAKAIARDCMPRALAHEPSAMFRGLADAGYRPAPMIPGGDGAAGWTCADGRRDEFGEHFAAQALDHMPADAEALPGIVAGDGVLIVRATGALRDTLPETPATWVVGDCRTSIYRAPDARLSDLMEFGLVRSFGWRLPGARHHALARIEAKARACLSDKDRSAEDRAAALDVLDRAERIAFRVPRPDCLFVLERDVAVEVPAGVMVPSPASLPVLSENDIAKAMESVGAYNGGGWPESIAEPYDPVHAWELARGAKLRGGKVSGLACDDVLIPAECPDGPKRDVIRFEFAKMRAHSLRDFERVALSRAQAGDGDGADDAFSALAEPLWSLNEARRDRIRAQVAEIIAKAAGKPGEGGEKVPGADAPSAVQPAPTGNLMDADQRHKQQQRSGVGVASLVDLLDGDAFDLPDDDSAIKPIAFLMGKDFARGFLTATIAPGGVGKSVLSLVEALSLATGRDLLSHDPRSAGAVKERVPVLLLSLEDSPDIVRMRLTAICRFYGITKDEIGDRLRVRCGVELPAGLIVAETTRNGTEIKRPIIDALVAIVKRRGYGKVTVDPFVSSHAISENDNTAMQRAAEAWREVAHKGNCSVELIHHARKLNGERVTAEDARGGSALIAACRFTRTLSPMDDDTAAHFRMSARDTIGLVGIFRDGKQNLVQRQAGAQWFKLTEQALYNGPGGAPESTVGVPAYWSAKAQAQAEPLDVALIVKALMGQTHAYDPRSPRWIGHAIARALSKDVTEDRPLIKGWITDLEDEELIALDTVEDQHRKKRKVYAVTTAAIRQFVGGEMPWGEPTGRPAASSYGDEDGSDCPF